MQTFIKTNPTTSSTELFLLHDEVSPIEIGGGIINCAVVSNISLHTTNNAMRSKFTAVSCGWGVLSYSQNKADYLSQQGFYSHMFTLGFEQVDMSAWVDGFLRFIAEAGLYQPKQATINRKKLAFSSESGTYQAV